MKLKHPLCAILLMVGLLPFAFSQDCPDGYIETTFILHADNWPSEIGWSMTSADSVYASYEAGDFSIGDSTYVWSFCIPDDACVIFAISDTYGDGLSGTGGIVGQYTLMADSVIIAQNTAYGFGESSIIGCPTGSACSEPDTAALDNVYTTSSDDYYYYFMPDTTGTFSISTCDLNDCDTKIWVYDDCPDGIPADDNTGTIFYDDNEGGCGEQARINALLEMGSPIVIRIGQVGEGCMGEISWTITYEGPVMGCTDPQSCNYNALATVDDGSCIPQGSPDCPDGPDLEVQEDVLRNSMILGQEFVSDNDCYINEGCLRGYGTRDVVRFTTHFKNIGEFDYYIGEESLDNPQFSYDNCHNHFHYESYAEYLLVNAGGNIVPIGHKNGFCVIDLECSGGGIAKYGCSNMGITAGCGDIYNRSLDCQWIDVTDVADGDYTLVARVNWLNQPDFNGQVESRQDNNWATACFNLDRSSGELVMTPYFNDCDVYTDCDGVPFGLAVPDCTGECGGTVLMGDLDNSESQTDEDVISYIQQILGDDIAPTPCNDLNNDNKITVYDAALLNNCLNYIDGHLHEGGVQHDHCAFPDGVVNPNDTVTLSIIGHDPAANYVDIGVWNPTTKVTAYEFAMSGIMMTSVESLTDGTQYPFTTYGNFDAEIIGITFPDSALVKSLDYQPLCRVYYQDILETEICIKSITDIVNEDYERAIPVIGGECILLTNTHEFSNNLEVRLQPNPFGQQAVLTIQHPDQAPLELNILDMTGKVVQQYGYVYPGTVTIEKAGLAPGMYYYELKGNNSHLVEKMVVY